MGAASIAELGTAQPMIQRTCAACDGEGEVQAKRASADKAPLTDTLRASLQRLRSSSGEPLPANVRGFMEPRFNRSFGAIRVHRDAAANALARSIRSRAFTVGNHIAFAPGAFKPNSTQGQRLLAHELAHTVQQGAASPHGSNATGGSVRPSIQRQTEPGAAPAAPLPGERVCNGVRRDVEFPTCDEVNPQPTGAPPSRERFAGDPTLNKIRAEAPGTNVNLLSRGRRSSGDAVELVQQAILSFGCRTRERNVLPNDGADRAFGPETERAVKKFQCQSGIATDGIVGPITLAQLDAFVGRAPAIVFPPGFEDFDRLCLPIECPVTPEQARFPSPPDAVASAIPQLRDPRVPGGALCRGACGENCPSSCRNLGDLELFVTDDRGQCFTQCTYRRVQSCFTHDACRQHDRCYDDCVINENETGLCTPAGANPCHCDCDAGCIGTMGGGPNAIATCIRFALGSRSAPTDGELRFSDPPRQGIAGPRCLGARCVDTDGLDVPDARR